ncbi:MAG: hypothetical protein AAGD07_06080 [Planctomycetota bacterium]
MKKRPVGLASRLPQHVTCVDQAYSLRSACPTMHVLGVAPTPRGRHENTGFATVGGSPEHERLPNVHRHASGRAVGQVGNHERPKQGNESHAKTVVFVGASVRWAARSASQAGYRVIGIDLFGDEDTRAACQAMHIVESPTELMRVAHGVADRTNATVETVGGFTGSRFGRHAAATPSGHLREDSEWGIVQSQRLLAKSCGLLLPRQWPVNQGPVEDGPHQARADQPLPNCLIKRFDSSGGLGISRHIPDASSPSCEAFAKPTSRSDAYLEALIAGRAMGTVYLAAQEGVICLGSCRNHTKRLPKKPFVYAGNVGPEAIHPMTQEKLDAFATGFATQNDHRGLFNVDWIDDRSGGAWYLETNARPSGSCEVLEYSLRSRDQLAPNQSLMGMHLDARRQREPLPSRKRLTLAHAVPLSPDSRFLKRIVYSLTSGVPRLPSVPITQMGFTLADVPPVGLVIKRHEPIATLLTSLERFDPLVYRSAIRSIQGSLLE